LSLLACATNVRVWIIFRCRLQSLATFISAPNI
jgi:hypothetical protein